MGNRSDIGGNGDSVPGWIRNQMKDAFGGASILLVEDDPDIRELMATLLRLAGFEPTVCSNAEFGLQQLREQTFDMVLTDYALPNRNGAWLLQQATAEGLLEATPVPKSRRPGDDDDGHDCPDPIELILYVSRYSPKSAAAVANIKQALARFKSSRVKLTIYDLAETPDAGAADAVAFTPTLVKRSPGPRTFILGHINNPDLLVELIQACGEEAT